MIQLRDYQQECLDSIEKAGNGRWLCQLATGMGKTVIFANIPLRGRELILSHRQELVHQPLKYFDKHMTAVEMASERAADSLAPVVSASVQTMGRRMTQYAPDTFDTIIVDEAHHAAADSYRKILGYFQPRRILGFTATPNRADGVGLECAFDEIIYQKDLHWGIEHGYLSPITCKQLNIGYDLASVATRMGDYAASDLERVLNVDKCNDAIAEAISNIAEPPVLIFAVDVRHAHAIAETINKKLWNPKYPKGYARAVSANSKDRADVIADYMRGELPVLVNCMLFTEGTDLPNTRTVMIARPTKSLTMYTQMVGRGTRLVEGKSRCLLIDCVGVSDKPLCTAPSLLGLDPQDIPKRYRREIEGDLLDDIPQIIAQKADTPESWIANVKTVDIWAKANNYVLHDVNWQKRPDGSLFLSLPDASREHGILWFTCTAPNALGAVTFNAPRYNCTGPAQKVYDTAFDVLRTQYGDAGTIWRLSSAQRWGAAPATEKQIDYLQTMAKRRKVDISGMIERQLTKMQAGCLISHLKDYKTKKYQEAIA